MTTAIYPGFRANEPTAIGRSIVTAADAAAVRMACGVYSTDQIDSQASNYATAAQGVKADSALQPSDITSGTITAGTGDIDFDDLGGLANAVDISGGIRVHNGDGSTNGRLDVSTIYGDSAYIAMNFGTGVQVWNITPTAMQIKVPISVSGNATVTGVVTTTKVANYSAALDVGHSLGAKLIGPIEIASKTIATLPSAAASNKQRFLVTDSTPANRQVFSNGSAWYYEDGTAV